MKVVCVAGGSYKSIYLNDLTKLKSCDLLVFNFGVLYNYVVKEELLGNAFLTKEILTLAKKLKCVVVAGVYVENLEGIIKSILVCDGEKIFVAPVFYASKIYCCNKMFIAGDENTNYERANKIVLTNKRIYPNLDKCSGNKIYIFCDKYGASLINQKKIERKFNKCSKFILK